MKKMLGTFVQFFIDLPLRAKLMAFFATVLALSSLLFYAAAYGVVSTEYREQIQYSAELSYAQAYDYTQKTIQPLLYASEMLSLNNGVQDILAANVRMPELSRSLPQQYRDMLQLMATIQSAANPNEIEQIRIYVQGGPMYAGQDVFFSDLADLAELPGFRDPSRQFFWTAPEEVVLTPNEPPTRVVSLVRKIRSPNRFDDVIGAVRVSIRADVLDDIIFRSNITSEGLVCMVNDKNEVICTSDQARLEDWMLGAETGFSPGTAGSSWEQASWGGERFLAKSLPVENTDWRMVALIPLREINRSASRMGVLMFVVMLVIIFVASLLAFAFSGWFTGRLRKLVKQMVSVRQGSLDVEIRSADKDEVGMLYDSFDYMVQELRQYVKRQYKNGKDVKSAELRALQAQINPHFLYNTLDLINWEAMNHRVPEIAEITRSLARFYKLGLQKGKEIVTLEDELEHVREYVNIQNHRFENRIQLLIDAPEEVRRLPILKILLQPLVENAILHGLMKRGADEECLLEIKAWRSGGVLFITIRDNGVGMTEEQLAGLLLTAEDHAEGEHGYGARNVEARIRLFYGEEYGMRFESRPGTGTTVTICIPAA